MANKKWNDERRNMERENKRIIHYTRKCHDCGKMTSDYRCAECRAKWRMKYHVTGGDYDVEE